MYRLVVVFRYIDIVYPLQVGLCWLRGAPGVLQCWMLSVAGGSWVSQQSAVVAVWSF